jgi:hypothetical protein
MQGGGPEGLVSHLQGQREKDKRGQGLEEPGINSGC